MKNVGVFVIGFVSAIGFVQAASLPPEVVGAWSVPGFYGGRTFAVYTIGADGKVKTELPLVPADLKEHWMDGGEVSLDEDGKTYRFRNERLFKKYGLREAAKSGLPFVINSSTQPPKIVWKIGPPLKDRFPDNPAMSAEDLAKAKREREPWREEIEKSPWTVLSVNECNDSALTSSRVGNGSRRIFEKLSKPGGTFRFRRDPSKNDLRVDLPRTDAEYLPSSLERSILISSPAGAPLESLVLLDQGAEDGKPGVHRFRVSVERKCQEIVASNVPVMQDRDGKESGPSQKSRDAR